MTDVDGGAIREAVRAHYAASALRVTGGSTGGCCGPADAGGAAEGLYAGSERAEAPGDAVRASMGCGNPVAVADLRPGETVLDLGSGGGLDVLLSARRVGPTGLAYGLDMTPEMLDLAERNRAAAGAENVRFLAGTMEAIPLPDASVDAVISNCVINLSADKAAVLREAFRVLRPGGRFAVADILAPRAMTAAERADLAAWAGCVAGALDEATYRRRLAEAGFTDVTVRVTHAVDTGAASACGCGSGDGAAGADGGCEGPSFVSAIVTARRP